MKHATSRILICDDSIVNARIVKTLLDKEGYHSEIVATGEEAMDRIVQTRFDLILLDLELPGVNGFEITRVLRSRHSEAVYLPIILLTANQDYESRIEGLKAGATDFVTKPYDPAELLTRIRNHVAAKAMYDQLLTINRELEKERRKVFDIQRSLLPREMPQIEGYEFAASYMPSSLASGDFYDFFPLPNGKIFFAVADVSGHGLPSAMYMATLRASFHAEATDGAAGSQLLERMNRVLFYGMDDFSFVTCYLGELNPSTGMIRQFAAGHHPAILHDRNTDEISVLEIRASCPLGLFEKIEFEEVSIEIKPGQRLLAFTDGVTDQANAAGEHFELQGLYAALRAAKDLHADEAIEQITNAVRDYMPNKLPTDDITLLIVDRLSS